MVQILIGIPYLFLSASLNNQIVGGGGEHKHNSPFPPWPHFMIEEALPHALMSYSGMRSSS